MKVSGMKCMRIKGKGEAEIRNRNLRERKGKLNSKLRKMVSKYA